MHSIPKRLLLAGAAPLALAAMYGGSLAFAQSGEPTPTPAPTEDAAPTSPEAAPPSTTPESTAPGRARGSGCPEKGGAGSGTAPVPGGSSESDDSAPDTSTQIRTRANGGSTRPF